MSRRDLGLIVVDSGSGSGPQGGGQQGRPSHRLLADPSGPVALAAQVHPDGFAVALVGLGGTVVARRIENGPVPADPGQALAPVAAACRGAAWPVGSARRASSAAVAGADGRHQAWGTAVRALYVGWPDGAPVRDIFARGASARLGVRDPRGGPA